MWVEVAVQEDWIRRAQAYGERTGMQSMIVGKTGEYAVIDYLRQLGVQLREDQTPADRPDYFDILARGTLIEVKTTRKQEIKIAKATFDRDQRRRFGMYIGVKLSLPQKKAWICGYATKDDVQQARVIAIAGKQYYSLRLKDLKPIQDVLPFLKGER